MSMYELIHGSAHDIPIPDKSVHMIATSPPYLALRKYDGSQDVDWPAVEYWPMPDLKALGYPPLQIPAMSCPLGLEPTLEAYIGHLVLCLREWCRVLRNDGTCWVNLGDKSAGSGRSHTNEKNLGISKSVRRSATGRPKTRLTGLAAKNLCFVPHRFAMAAQAEGWVARSAIVWAKGLSFLNDYAGSCMPDSAQDRPNGNGYEMVFLLSKSPKYFYDSEAVKENAVKGSSGSTFMNGKTSGAKAGGVLSPVGTGDRVEDGKRNLRNVWAINPQGYKGAHFACWPPALVEPMILAGSSARGVCSECGAPWRRATEKTFVPQPDVKDAAKLAKAGTKGLDASNGWGGTPQGRTQTATTGWKAACSCDADNPVPATVLDPFSGSGTTGKKTVELGRHYIGVDICERYNSELAPQRIGNTQIIMAW